MKKLYLLGLIFFTFGNFSQAGPGGNVEDGLTMVANAIKEASESIAEHIQAEADAFLYTFR